MELTLMEFFCYLTENINVLTLFCQNASKTVNSKFLSFRKLEQIVVTKLCQISLFMSEVVNKSSFPQIHRTSFIIVSCLWMNVV